HAPPLLHSQRGGLVTAVPSADRETQSGATGVLAHRCEALLFYEGLLFVSCLSQSNSGATTKHSNSRKQHLRVLCETSAPSAVKAFVCDPLKATHLHLSRHFQNQVSPDER